MASTKPPVIMIREVTGDILGADVEALVNTVNTRGVMGAGLALRFKRAYPAMADSYAERCRQKQIRLGEVSIWDTGAQTFPHYIINFPTKDHWKQPSTLEWIERGLNDLRRRLVELEIESIAIPRLGCGLGGLRWTDVRPLINTSLGDLSKISVFFYSNERNN